MSLCHDDGRYAKGSLCNFTAGCGCWVLNVVEASLSVVQKGSRAKEGPQEQQKFKLTQANQAICKFWPFKAGKPAYKSLRARGARPKMTMHCKTGGKSVAHSCLAGEAKA